MYVHLNKISVCGAIDITVVACNAIMLLLEWKAGDKNGICKNTRAIVFYSTPHRGSRVAALKQTTQMLVWPTVEVQELREGNGFYIPIYIRLTRKQLDIMILVSESPQLLRLHEEFLEMLKEYPIEIVSFAETKSTLVTALKFPFQFVSLDSAGNANYVSYFQLYICVTLPHPLMVCSFVDIQIQFV